MCNPPGMKDASFEAPQISLWSIVPNDLSESLSLLPLSLLPPHFPLTLLPLPFDRGLTLAVFQAFLRSCDYFWDLQ